MSSKRSSSKAVAKARAAHDSMQNFVSGLGVAGRDKAAGGQFVFLLLDQVQLESAYRSDWIARKAVDLPAQDATRNWRNWQADANQIEALEAEEKRLRVQSKVASVLKKARLYGGAALVMGTGDEKPELELQVDSVKQGGLKFLHVVSKHEIQAGEVNVDVLSPLYGEPSYYTVSSSSKGSVRVHPSRVIRFVGRELPSLNSSGADGWGDSILQAVYETIRDAASTSAGIAALVQEAKVDIIRIPNLMTNISSQEYRNRLTERFQLANVSKSIVNALILDKEEEWERVVQTFAGLPDIEHLFLMIASGAADIPVTRMLGQSPAGLTSTGESDLRNYYDNVANEQSNVITPTLQRLDEVLIRSALGTRPPEVHYEWASLWQMTDQQAATVALAKAQTFQIDATMGLINQDALGQARTNQLIEDGTYPGLEAAIEEFPDDDEKEETPEQRVEFALQQQARQQQLADARPRSLYVRRDVKNWREIAKWAKAQGFQSTLAEHMHITICFSRTPVDWLKVSSPWSNERDGTMTIPAGGARIVEPLGDKGAIVLLFNSSDLSWRHVAIKEAGARWEFPDFQPHITLTYQSPAAMDLDLIEPYRGAIELGSEIFEEVIDDWEQGIAEVEV